MYVRSIVHDGGEALQGKSCCFFLRKVEAGWWEFWNFGALVHRPQTRRGCKKAFVGPQLYTRVEMMRRNLDTVRFKRGNV